MKNTNTMKEKALTNSSLKLLTPRQRREHILQCNPEAVLIDRPVCADDAIIAIDGGVAVYDWGRLIDVMSSVMDREEAEQYVHELIVGCVKVGYPAPQIW